MVGGVDGDRDMMQGSRTHYCLFDTAIGICGVAWSARGVVRLQLPESNPDTTEARLARQATKAVTLLPPAIEETIDQLQSYAGGHREDFSAIILDLTGIAAFEQSVYAVARTIPFGETLSYGEIARQIEAPDAARAVGQALGRNPIPIIIPCHRILAKGHRIGGFSAPGGARTKERLLALEGVHMDGGMPLLPGFA
jgi:methylated-DNA-[protein]-cysteine S-methyltransferase